MNKVGFFRSIQLKFIIIYILLLLVAIQVIGSFFTRELEDELINSFEDSVNSRVDLMGYNLEQAFDREREDDDEGPTLLEEIQNIVSDVDTADITNLQVINSQSRILGTNDVFSQDEVGKKTTREMVQSALFLDEQQENTVVDGETGNRVYVQAVPLFDDEDNVAGVIYLEASLEGVYDQLQNINEIFLRGSILAIVVSAFIGILVARTITKPISEMRSQAQTMAKGDFTQKVNVYSKDEIGQLADTFNDLNSRLKHSYSTIEEERRKLSSVLSNMSDGVISTDGTGAVTLMNETAGRLIGRNPEDIIGAYLLDVIPLEDKIVDISQLQDNGSMIIDFSDEEQYFLIRAEFSTVFDDEDEVTGFITVITDVTEQERIDQERREFVSNVSHELRTPLTTMKSYMEALTDGAWQDKEIAPKFLSVTQNETERMIRMVNDLLQLSKMDTKDHALQMERTDFVRYFHEVIDRFDMNKPEHVILQRQLPKSALEVWLDKDKMTQVLDNVISNAIKYSPEGGVIRLKVEKQRHHLLVSVQDQGLGIAYDKLEKIFERFYRADKARTRNLGGTGLGLAISKEIIEAQHGRIWAKSKEGKGTTILFTLPLMNEKRRGYY
ncbi:two-component system sensor histidine kinase VicK [Virgibacillus natechei]|uniref:histidine kinase n=1 Tax=Virgibacillus natechei TaxID=1216297 RepID=A0ABS4IK08_9BACI|nr:cell wall metabolism sensor histidine kinase WalK [Virgibacillus natechei]MBP1971297.1 two-component system sensor histidine kinase VicK [Virgibacillus natechei]UZD12967.1 cell wall metabolism sensor histidine kinase WalK [Virgibacillus natechei]